MKKLLPVLFGLVCVSGAAQAQTVYSGVDAGAGAHPVADAAKTAFLADAATLGTVQGAIDFEDLSLGYSSPLVIAPGVTVTFSGALTSFSGVVTGGDLNTGFNTTTGGDQYLRFMTDSFSAPGSVTFSFDDPISAFGGFITSLESFFGTTTVTFFDGSVQSYNLAGPFDPSTQFWGVTDLGRSFTSITFTEVPTANGRDGFGFDDLYFVTAAVPEPSTWLMLLVGFGAVGGAMRVKRRRDAALSFA